MKMTWRTWRTWLVLAMAAGLAACASLLGPREAEFPLAKLQESLSSRFPFNNRYLEIFDIYVSNPKLALQPETNRVSTSMDVSIAPPFMDKPWQGTLAVSGGLKVDPARNALVLADPRVENFAMNGVDGKYSRQIGKIGALLAEQLLKDMPLYTFKPEDFRYAGVAYLPTRIATRANSLVVTFEPAR
jgi:hypothetical protein